MVARVSPPSTARRQASIFGTMPDSRVGINSRSSDADSSVMTSVLFGQSRYRPSTSVSTTSRSADRATASAAAAVSAFVVHHAVAIRGNARHHGHLSGCDQAGDRLGAYFDHIANQAEVDFLAVHDHPSPLGGEQPPSSDIPIAKLLVR